MLNFSSSSFDAVTTTAAMNATPADKAKATAKDGSEEEATGEAVGALDTADGGGGSSSSSST